MLGSLVTLHASVWDVRISRNNKARCPNAKSRGIPDALAGDLIVKKTIVSVIRLGNPAALIVAV